MKLLRKLFGKSRRARLDKLTALRARKAQESALREAQESARTALQAEGMYVPDKIAPRLSQIKSRDLQEIEDKQLKVAARAKDKERVQAGKVTPLHASKR